MADFSHLTEQATARMVDVSAKTDTIREARAIGEVVLPEAAVALLSEAAAREIASVARVAGIQAMKQTAALIPMCHQLALEGTTVTVELDRPRHRFMITVDGKIRGKTGVEMECLVGASIAGATVYDMIKAQAPEAVLGPYHVLSKSGGKLGTWQNPANNR